MMNSRRIHYAFHALRTVCLIAFTAAVSATVSSSVFGASGMEGMDHSNMPGMKMESPAKPAPKPKAQTKPAANPQSMESMDHSNMPGMKPAPKPAPDNKSMEGMDHTNMPGMQPETKPAGGDSKSMEGMDHSTMPGMAPKPMTGTDQDGMRGMQDSGDKAMDSMGGMQMGPMQGGKPPADARDPDAHAEGLPRGHMRGMDMADHNPYGLLLLDKLEYARHATLRLDGQAWYGGDYNKLWLKVDGDRVAGRLGATRTEVLWDRAFATYWSTQLGARHDFGQGPGRTWGALGVQGLAPYWFDLEATAYVGDSGRTAARFEVNYDVLFTQRLILQPNLEINAYGKNDRDRGIGSGISDVEAGLRLRYEIKRQFAPYVGVSWRRKLGNTADFARAAGEDVGTTSFVAGVRLWF